MAGKAHRSMVCTLHCNKILLQWLFLQLCNLWLWCNTRIPVVHEVALLVIVDDDHIDDWHDPVGNFKTVAGLQFSTLNYSLIGYVPATCMSPWGLYSNITYRKSIDGIFLEVKPVWICQSAHSAIVEVSVEDLHKIWFLAFNARNCNLLGCQFPHWLCQTRRGRSLWFWSWLRRWFDSPRRTPMSARDRLWKPWPCCKSCLFCVCRNTEGVKHIRLELGSCSSWGL